MRHHLEFSARSAVLCVGFLLVASIAAAQTPARPPAGAIPGTSAFAQMIQGHKVIVTTSDGKEHRGLFTASQNAVVAGDNATGLSLPFDQIVKVRKVTHRVRNGALIGFAAGLGIGLSCLTDDCPGAFVAFTGEFGAVIGAIVGGVRNANHRTDDTIYDANRRKTTVMFAPVLSPSRKSLTVSLTWR